MAEIETTKKRPNKFTDVFKIVAATVAGGVSNGGLGSIVLWGGGLAVATAITAFSIKINKKKKMKQQSPGKAQGEVNLQSLDPMKNCSTALIRVIEDECINGFRLALHNPSPPLHRHAWSPLSLSKMEIEGQEIVSTQYLILDDKIVLQVEWRHETTTSKEEIVIIDNLQTRKITSSDNNHSRIFDLEQSALQMLTSDDFAGKDPLGTIIQTIKDKRKALEHIVTAKQAPGRIEEHENGHGRQVVKSSEQIEESSMEEKATGRDDYEEDGNEEGSPYIPIGDAKVGILQQTIYKMRMMIWVFLVVVVMLILLASPKLLTY